MQYSQKQETRSDLKLDQNPYFSQKMFFKIGFFSVCFVGMGLRFVKNQHFLYQNVRLDEAHLLSVYIFIPYMDLQTCSIAITNCPFFFLENQLFSHIFELHTIVALSYFKYFYVNMTCRLVLNFWCNSTVQFNQEVTQKRIFSRFLP